MTRCAFSLWLFNFYTGYIILYAGLHKSQAGIKIAGRNINIHRYEVDTSLMAESKEELKSFLMRRGDAKTGLKLNIQKTIYKIHIKYMREKWKQRQILFSWAPIPLWTLIAAPN